MKRHVNVVDWTDKAAVRAYRAMKAKEYYRKKRDGILLRLRNIKTGSGRRGDFMIVWKPFRGGSYSHVFHMGVGHQNRLWVTEEELKMHVRLGNIPPVPPIMVNKFLDDLNNSPNP